MSTTLEDTLSGMCSTGLTKVLAFGGHFTHTSEQCLIPLTRCGRYVAVASTSNHGLSMSTLLNQTESLSLPGHKRGKESRPGSFPRSAYVGMNLVKPLRKAREDTAGLPSSRKGWFDESPQIKARPPSPLGKKALTEVIYSARAYKIELSLPGEGSNNRLVLARIRSIPPHNGFWYYFCFTLFIAIIFSMHLLLQRKARHWNR
ncbi:hypothetical protein BDW72DRAFT_45076 [Aspergillus terricola var. indicus]